MLNIRIHQLLISSFISSNSAYISCPCLQFCSCVSCCRYLTRFRHITSASNRCLLRSLFNTSVQQCVHFVTVSRDLHGFDAPCTEVARVHGKCTGNEKFEHLMHGFAKFQRFLPFQRHFSLNKCDFLSPREYQA